MADQFLIRDVYAEDIVRKIAGDIHSEYKAFDKKGFLNSILPQLAEQTYSERKENIVESLINYMPDDYVTSINILLHITPPPYDGEADSDMIGRFYVSTFTAYISRLGLEHYDISINALYEMTKSFTAEWDIRSFILAYPEKTFALLKKWTKDKNMHVRRLVSEGSRPNLPWGKKLKFVDSDPENTTLPLLTLLQNDSEEYVRRSVANHLNDLAKNNGDLVVNYLKEWRSKNTNPDKERMIQHALRTLIKQGHRGALALIGYDDDFDLNISIDDYTKEVLWSQKFEFTFTIQNNKKTSQKLLIDFIIGFQKKDGSISNKVFKLKKVELGSKESISIDKFHSFKPITTRVYHSGEHKLMIQINGQITSEISFMLLKP